MSLLDKVTDHIIFSLTTDLAEHIADNFGLDTNKVSIVIQDYLNCNKTKRVEESVENIKPCNKNIKPAITSANICTFIITRGKKNGLQCNTTIRGDDNFCSKHRGN
jgi:hypothetical protein